VGRDPPRFHLISHNTIHKDTGHRVLRQADGLNLSNRCLLRSVSPSGSLTRTSTDSSTTVGQYPSVDCQMYFVDTILSAKYYLMVYLSPFTLLKLITRKVGICEERLYHSASLVIQRKNICQIHIFLYATTSSMMVGPSTCTRSVAEPAICGWVCQMYKILKQICNMMDDKL
jgi:hypothetical protein